MYFSKVTLSREALSVDALARLLRGDGYRAHQHLWGLFGDRPERRRDFLYRQEYGREGPLFYVVSTREPQQGEGPWQVDTKPYAPKVATGDRLAFMLRVNPVRSRPAERGKRDDVVMDAKRRMRNEGAEIGQDDLVQREGLAWLEERAGRHGFRLEAGSLRVHGYRQHRLFKPRRASSRAATGDGADGGKPIRFSTLDYEGLLTVTEPAPFLETLLRGLGPAKGFGCGLLMVRRP